MTWILAAVLAAGGAVAGEAKKASGAAYHGAKAAAGANITSGKKIFTGQGKGTLLQRLPVARIKEAAGVRQRELGRLRRDGLSRQQGPAARLGRRDQGNARQQGPAGWRRDRNRTDRKGNWGRRVDPLGSVTGRLMVRPGRDKTSNRNDWNVNLNYEARQQLDRAREEARRQAERDPQAGRVTRERGLYTRPGTNAPNGGLGPAPDASDAVLSVGAAVLGAARGGPAAAAAAGGLAVLPTVKDYVNWRTGGGKGAGGMRWDRLGPYERRDDYGNIHTVRPDQDNDGRPDGTHAELYDNDNDGYGEETLGEDGRCHADTCVVLVRTGSGEDREVFIDGQRDEGDQSGSEHGGRNRQEQGQQDGEDTSASGDGADAGGDGEESTGNEGDDSSDSSSGEEDEDKKEQAASTSQPRPDGAGCGGWTARPEEGCTPAPRLIAHQAGDEQEQEKEKQRAKLNREWVGQPSPERDGSDECAADPMTGRCRTARNDGSWNVNPGKEGMLDGRRGGTDLLQGIGWAVDPVDVP